MKFTGNIVVLDNLRSAHNVGSVYRTAYSYGFTNIVHIGITPNNENPSFKSASRGAEKHISTFFYKSMDELIDILKREKYILYSLEISQNAIPLNKIKIQQPFAIVLGNEALGVSKIAMDNCDAIIEIETINKRSLNVSIAFGIFAYTIQNNG